MLICPICQSPLTIADKTWHCDGTLNPKNTQHPFDVARQGYVNLLPVQSKKSKHPGDSQASILARQRFLQAGFYQPLQHKVAELVAEYLPKATSVRADSLRPTNWLDIGCGEGYYSQQLARVTGINHLIAIDISKPAVLELAKSAKQQGQLWLQTWFKKGENGRNGNIVTEMKKWDKENERKCTTSTLSEFDTVPQIQFGYYIIPMVASASHLPLADNSVQGISSIFSPILPDELARVVTDEGVLLIAKPDEGHLASVRAGLFDTVREHNSDKFLQQLAEVGFTLLHTEQVQSDFCLNRTQLADLLTMTPYSYRAKRENREALLAQADNQGLKTQAKFVVYVLAKQQQKNSKVRQH